MSVLNVIATSIQDTLTFYKRRQQFDNLLKYIRKTASPKNKIQNVRELNALLDLIIVDFSDQLRIKQLERLPIHEVQEEFVRQWMGLTFKGTFQARNGKIENLSTLHRCSNCILSIPKDDTRLLNFALSLKTALIHFEKYQLHCGLINTNGMVTVEARQNAISICIAIKLKKNKKLQNLEVTKVELYKCGDFKIHVTGFGNFGGNSVAKAIIKIFLNKIINDMKKDFENQLKIYIKRIIDQFTT